MQTRLQLKQKEDQEYQRLRQIMERHIGETELHSSLNSGDYDTAWNLIVCGGVNFDSFTPASHPRYPSSTALHCFARQAPPKGHDRTKFCNLLVEKSYNVINSLNAKEMPPLHLACQQGNVPLARALLRAKAGREQISSQTQTVPAPTERKNK